MTESITFDLYKLNTKNISETTETQKTNEENSENKKASSVSIPIGESTENKTGDVSDFLDKRDIQTLEQKKIKIPKVEVTKGEVEKAKNFLEKHAKELGLDEDSINSLSREEKSLYVALALAYEKGQISKEEFIETAVKYGDEAVTQKIRELYPEGTNKVDEERTKKINAQIQKTAKFRMLCHQKVASGIFGETKEETQKLREEYFCSVAKRNEKEQQKLLEKAAESLPKCCSEEVAKELLETTMNYSKTYNSSLLTTCKKAGYSDTFISKLTDITEKTYEKVKKNYQIFSEKFWNSTKGQAIKSYSKTLLESYVAQTQECAEKEQIVEEKKEEATAAEQEAAKAQEQADKMKADSDALISKYKADELPDEKQERILKTVSPQAFLRKQWADADLKKANEKQYDAQSAKRLAEKFSEYAQQELVALKARIAIIQNSIMSMIT